MVLKTLALYFPSILLLLIIEIHGKTPFQIIMDSFSCTTNPAYTLPPNCSIDKSYDPPRGYVDIQMHREVKTQRYSLNLTISVNKRKRTILSVKNKDICEFFEGRSTSVIGILRKIADQFGTLPNKCPVDKNFHYLFKNITIDIGKFPLYPVETDFHLISRNTAGKDFLYTLEFTGRIRRSYDKNNITEKI